MITPTICQLAVAMAGTSLLLQLASAIASSRTPGPDPDPVVATPEPELRPMNGISIQPVTSGREWSRRNLLKLCQRHQVHTAEWRAHARKGALASALLSMGVTHG